MRNAFLKCAACVLCAIAVICSLAPAKTYSAQSMHSVVLHQKGEGEIVLRKDGEDVPVESAQNEELSQRSVEIEHGLKVTVQAKAKAGWTIEELRVDEKEELDAIGKVQWSKEIVVDAPVMIMVRFAPLAQKGADDDSESSGFNKDTNSPAPSRREDTQMSDLLSDSLSSAIASSLYSADSDADVFAEISLSSSLTTSSDDDASSDKGAMPRNGLSVAEAKMYENISLGFGGMQSNGIWRLSNGRNAYCGDYRKASPMAGAATTAPEVVDNPALRKALYYGYEGPQNILQSKGFSPEVQIVITDDLVSQALTGGSISMNVQPEPNWNKVVKPIWEEVMSKPDPSNYKVQKVQAIGKGYNHLGEFVELQPLVYGEAKADGQLYVLKRSAQPAITGRNPSAYSLAGARFFVYRGKNSTSGFQAMLTTDDAGKTETISLAPGFYTIQEGTAPAGYQISRELKTVEVREGVNAAVYADVTFNEEPVYFQPSLVLKKRNARASGDTRLDLSNAQFTFCYFAADPMTPQDRLPSKPTRTWVYKTDASGEIRLDDDHLVSGTPILDRQNRHALPIGVLTIQETKAPPAFKLNSQVFVVPLGTIHSHGAPSIPFEQPVEVPEIPYDFDLYKYDKETKEPIAGVEFELRAPNGKVTKVVTDEQGLASLDFDQLGTWHLLETKAPGDYSLENRGYTLYVEADRVVLNASAINAVIEDKKLKISNVKSSFAIRVEKRSGTGKRLKGAVFTLYADPERKKILAQQTTPANGEIVFDVPTKYANTTVYLEETSPPSGYLPELGEDRKPRLHRIDAAFAYGLYLYQVDGCDLEKGGPWSVGRIGKKSALIWKLINEQEPVYTLPKTGSVSQMLCMAASLCAAAGGLYASRRRDESGGSRQ